jgi:antitoxin component YwqK of YwqJK toxin-antitoxin module
MKKLFVLFVALLFSSSLWAQKEFVAWGTCVNDTSFYDNGNIKEIRPYCDSLHVLHGTCILYFENGDTSAIANYKQGKKHGIWKVWHPTGAVAYELFYHEGEKAGIWYAYNEKGELQNKREY